jgi:S-adenosylmethionine synthetase
MKHEKMKIQLVSIISELGMTLDHIFNAKRNNSERCNDTSSISNFTVVFENQKIYRLLIMTNRILKSAGNFKKVQYFLLKRKVSNRNF